MKICAVCGATNKDEAEKCEVCGHSLLPPIKDYELHSPKTEMDLDVLQKKKTTEQLAELF